MRTVCHALALICLLAAFSVAQATPKTTKSRAKAGAASAATTEGRHRTALELVHLLMPRQHTDQMIAQIGQQFIYAAAADYKRRGLTIPPDFESKMKDALNGLVTYNELTDWGANVYAQRFTTAEMRQMIVFYNGAVGRKLIQAQPDIGRATMQQLLRTVDQRLPAAMVRQGLTPPQPRVPPSPAGAAPTPPPAPAPPAAQPPKAPETPPAPPK